MVLFPVPVQIVLLFASRVMQGNLTGALVVHVEVVFSTSKKAGLIGDFLSFFPLFFDKRMTFSFQVNCRYIYFMVRAVQY